MRAFVAIPVPADVRARLDAALAACRSGPDALRWSHPATWHVTLRFLGEVADELGGPLEQALRTAVAEHEPFSLRLGAPGHFRRSTLWYGLEADPPEALAALADAVRLATAEVVPDRNPQTFRAHLTVARSRRNERAPTALIDALPTVDAAWRVDEVMLYRSELRADRAHHEPVVTVGLSE